MVKNARTRDSLSALVVLLTTTSRPCGRRLSGDLTGFGALAGSGRWLRHQRAEHTAMGIQKRYADSTAASRKNSASSKPNSRLQGLLSCASGQHRRALARHGNDQHDPSRAADLRVKTTLSSAPNARLPSCSSLARVFANAQVDVGVPRKFGLHKAELTQAKALSLWNDGCAFHSKPGGNRDDREYPRSDQHDPAVEARQDENGTIPQHDLSTHQGRYVSSTGIPRPACRRLVGSGHRRLDRPAGEAKPCTTRGVACDCGRGSI